MMMSGRRTNKGASAALGGEVVTGAVITGDAVITGLSDGEGEGSLVGKRNGIGVLVTGAETGEVTTGAIPVG
jgi:hypothetical protein